jgi:hypothetical protein
LGEGRIANHMKQLLFQDQNLKVAAEMCVDASKMLEMLNPLQDVDGFPFSVTRTEKPAEHEKIGPDRESGAGQAEED